MHKAAIIEELGIPELLLPKDVNNALLANDRVKYFFSLIQMSKSHADHPDEDISNLMDGRLASNVQDKKFDVVVSQTTKIGPSHYYIPFF